MEKPITLIGFMGSGKSTIGKQIAVKKGLEFTDLDSYIEALEGKSIPAIFEQRGEKEFRKIETNCLQEILMIPDQVIALGGGTPCFHNNIDSITSKSTSIYLKVSPEDLTNRLLRSPNPRPLIKGKSREDLLSYIQKELRKREKYYLQAAFVIESDHIRADDLLRLIFI